MSSLDLLLRWLHILGAVALAGGVIFWRFALLNAVDTLPAAARTELGAALRSRWSKIVMASSGLLLVTGLVNFMILVQGYSLDKSAFPGSKYHMLFGIKFLLALGVFVLSALLAGRTGAAEKLRRNERLWLNVNVLLVVAVVCLGGLLKFADRNLKSTSSLRPAAIPAHSMATTHPSLTDLQRGE